MKENDLEENLYKMETNNIDLPINLDGEKIFQFIINKINNRHQIQKKINEIMINKNKQMDSFIEYWKNMIGMK